MIDWKMTDPARIKLFVGRQEVIGEEELTYRSGKPNLTRNFRRTK